MNYNTEIENAMSKKRFVLYLGLVEFTGDLKEALILSEICRRFHENEHIVIKNGRRWTAITRSDWRNICGLTPREYDRAIKNLSSKNIVATKLFKDQNGNPVTHITLI